MEINKDKIILGIVGGVVAGFMFGIGYILAEECHILTLGI